MSEIENTEIENTEQETEKVYDFPETTVFYREILEKDDGTKALGMPTHSSRQAESWGYLEQHYDESELTYIGTSECGIYYLKGHEKPQPTRQELIDRKRAEMDAVVQDLIDNTARSKGYTNGAYCVGYVGDPDPEFDAQAVAFRSWRSQVWRKCYQLLDAVESGEISLDDITAEYVLSRLPKIEW